MAEGGDPEYPDVVLGLGAAWGFAPADQTSPALAGAAGALIDTAMTDQPVTELRIHGVSGSDGPTILEHPQTLQVAGDGTAGFFRRWSPDGRGQPSVPWKLEAYSWGGLTEKPLASAAWLLLAPFMMYNVAYFMLPPPAAGSDSVEVSGPVPHMGRGRGAAIAHVLLRLLALAATIQFTAAVVSVTVSTIAWQAAGQKNTLLPNWMGWYGDWTAGWRIALALAAVAGVVGVLWWVSVTTASKYEARTTTARPALAAEWPLTQPGFWRGSGTYRPAAGPARRRGLLLCGTGGSASFRPSSGSSLGGGGVRRRGAGRRAVAARHADGRPSHGDDGARGPRETAGRIRGAAACWSPRSSRWYSPPC